MITIRKFTLDDVEDWEEVMKNIGMEFAGSNGIRAYEKDVEDWEEVKYQLK